MSVGIWWRSDALCRGCELRVEFVGVVRPEAAALELESVVLGDRRFSILAEYAADIPTLRDTWKKAGLRIDPKEPLAGLVRH